MSCLPPLHHSKLQVYVSYSLMQTFSLPSTPLISHSPDLNTSTVLRRKTTRCGAKVSLSPRGIKGHMQLSKYVVELQGGRDSNFCGFFEDRCQSHHPTQSVREEQSGCSWRAWTGFARCGEEKLAIEYSCGFHCYMCE